MRMLRNNAMRVIRTGERNQKMTGISAEDVQCLSNFWDMTGMHQQHDESILEHIPKVRLRAPTQLNEGSENGSE